MYEARAIAYFRQQGQSSIAVNSFHKCITCPYTTLNHTCTTQREATVEYQPVTP